MATMIDWVEQLHEVLARDEACVLVTVVGARGSTPRECGAKMIVTATDAIGSIGGGNLEYESILAARALVHASAESPGADTLTPQLKEFALGARLGQCCGGHASILLERVSCASSWLGVLAEDASDVAPGVLVTVVNDDLPGDQSAAGAKLYITDRRIGGELPPGLEHLQGRVVESARRILRDAHRNGIAAPGLESSTDPRGLTLLYEPVREARPRLWLFGAGHVGRALVAVLADAPCRIVWVDGRAEQFPRAVPGNVDVRISEAPEYCTDEALASDSFLVMTHSHALDLRLVECVLRRADFRFLGLIGSHTKRRRFEKQLRRRGIDESRLSRLVCPIGISGITAKHPRSIAVAVAGQLMRRWEDEMQPGVDTDAHPSQHDASPREPHVGAR